MRIAFVSDIHANLQAWNAVHADILARRVDRIVCLGDIVGYGPSPAEVLTRVYTKVHHFVLGNHDAVVSGLMQPTGFNPQARSLIQETCGNLGPKAAEFFGKVPLALKSGNLRCSHGNPANPGAFDYLLTQDDAVQAWKRTSEPLIFIGHTHRPCLHVLSKDGTYYRIQPEEKPIGIEPAKRYIVNCGSVGMSRDTDFRAAYVVYDTRQRRIQWHRVAYDLEAFTGKVRDVYGKTELTDFLLKRFDTRHSQAVREFIDFTPGRAKVAESVTEEQEIRQMRARVVRWQVAAAVASLALLLGVASFWGFWKSLPTPRTLDSGLPAQILPDVSAAGISWQLIPTEKRPTGDVPAGWKVVLDDSNTQFAAFLGDRVVLSSTDARRTMEISLPRVPIAEARKARIQVLGNVPGPLSGEPPMLLVDYEYRDGRGRSGVSGGMLVLGGKVLSKQQTLSDIPQDVQELKTRLRACFRGTVELRQFTVTFPAEPGKPDRTTGPVDLNRATADDLRHVPGIGEILARRIVEYRNTHGPFRSVDDLGKVPGIGDATLSRLRKHLRVSAEPQ